MIKKWKNQATNLLHSSIYCRGIFHLPFKFIP